MSDNNDRHDEVDVVKHMIDLAKHTEAGVALVTVGIVEEWMQKLILTAGRSLSNTVAAKIFDGYGPLSTFSAKIEISYLFELIDETAYNDLKAIKEIRNKFAHTATAVFFASPELGVHFQKLTGWQKGCDPQKLFNDRCVQCVKEIESQINRRMWANALRDYPSGDPA